MKSLTLPDGQILAHEVTGSGPPLLLIMGTGADHSFWAPQVAGLSDSFQVITYDSRGTGESGSFARIEDCTPASLARDAAALLDGLGIGSAHVAGLSLGSCVAQELSLARPALVRSLALHGTWARTDEWFLRMVENMETGLHHGGLASFIRTATMWILSPEFHATNADMIAGLETHYASGPDQLRRVEGVLAHCHADRVHDASARLGSIRIPTLVAAGERDIQVPPRYGREVASLIPRARFHLFEGPNASHCCCFEMADGFNRLTREFIASAT